MSRGDIKTKVQVAKEKQVGRGVNSSIDRFPLNMRDRRKQEGANNMIPIGHALREVVSVGCEMSIDKSGPYMGKGLHIYSDGTRCSRENFSHTSVLTRYSEPDADSAFVSLTAVLGRPEHRK